MSFTTAAPLLAFTRKTETGFDDDRAYDTMYGHKKIDPPFTRHTLDSAIAHGPSWTRNHKSSAAGGYQFMHATLKDLKASLRLSGAMQLTPFEQDQLGYALLKRRGFEQFMAGKLSTEKFGKNLAQEWASFPVLADVQGAHRTVKRGQSYYAGDGMNKALVKPEQIEALLASMRNGTAPAQPYPAPADPSRPPTIVVIAVALVTAIVLAIFFMTKG